MSERKDQKNGSSENQEQVGNENGDDATTSLTRSSSGEASGSQTENDEIVEIEEDQEDVQSNSSSSSPTTRKSLTTTSPPNGESTATNSISQPAISIKTQQSAEVKLESQVTKTVSDHQDENSDAGSRQSVKKERYSRKDPNQRNVNGNVSTNKSTSSSGETHDVVKNGSAADPIEKQALEEAQTNHNNVSKRTISNNEKNSNWKASSEVQTSGEQKQSPMSELVHNSSNSSESHANGKDILPVKQDVKVDKSNHKSTDERTIKHEKSEKEIKENSKPTNNQPVSSRSKRGDLTEKGAKLGGQVHSSGKIPTRLGVPLVGTPFESGANTECIQLLRQLWNVHDEAIGFLKKIRSILSYFRQEVRNQDNEFENSFRGKRLSTTASSLNVKQSDSGKGKKYSDPAVISGGVCGGSGMTTSSSYGSGFPSQLADNFEQYKNNGGKALVSIVEGLGCINENFSDIEQQFLSLSVFQTQCKLALLAKVIN
jgi:hypothetical protein